MQAAAATRTSETRSKGFFRSAPSTAFDQYLHDIQKLPLITDAASPDWRRRAMKRPPSAS
jgi:RNA polymerase primary sigma factor